MALCAVTVAIKLPLSMRARAAATTWVCCSTAWRWLHTTSWGRLFSLCSLSTFSRPAPPEPSAAGLRLEYLHEFPYSDFPSLPTMERGADGWWRLPGKNRDTIPLLFSLKATR